MYLSLMCVVCCNDTTARILHGMLCNAVRKLIKYVDAGMGGYMPKNKLEINPRHEIVQGVHRLKSSHPDVARMVAEQVR